MLKKILAWGAVVVATLATALTVAAPAEASACPGSPALCYRYSRALQTGLNSSTNGVSALLTVEQPILDTPDYHTLAQYAASMGSDIIEMGWTIDPSLNGDNHPHLFVHRWKNGVPQGYNATDAAWTDYSGNATNAGADLIGDLHTSKLFGVVKSGSSWWLQYGTNYIGSYPDSAMTATYTSLSSVQYFGEIAESRMGTAQECTDMGNGLNPNGTAGGVSYAQVTGYTLYGTGHTTAGFASSTVTIPSKWGMSTPLGATSFSYGGTGDPHCTTPKQQAPRPTLSPAQAKRYPALVG